MRFVPMRREVLVKSAFTVLVAALIVFSTGCGGPTEPAIDAGPFKEAVARYLDENNMALAIKEVKTGPLVEGNKATMTASLTHAELGGPSVTWQFEFERSADGQWKAVRHQD